MITRTGHLHCSNQIEAELVASLVEEHVRLSREEPGCLSFSITRTTDPLVWAVDEAFEDQAAYEAHVQRTRSTVWHGATAHLRREFRTTGL